MEPFLSLLIFIIIAAIVLWLVSLILAQLPIGPTPRGLILALVAAILLIVFLQRFGLVQL